MVKPLAISLVIFGLVAFPFFEGRTELPKPQEKTTSPSLHRPIALALADEGKTLFVANRDSGTIVALDTQKFKKLAEVRIGHKLSDLAFYTGENRSAVLVTDEGIGEIVRLGWASNGFHDLNRMEVGMSPVSLAVSPNSRRVAVACLWPRRLVILNLAGAGGKVDSVGKREGRTVLDLPFAPRCQLWLEESRLLVADTFAGQMALVDPESKKIISLHNCGVHNIRGLALDREKKNLWLTHQTLHARGQTLQGEIRSSNVITNNVHKISVAGLLTGGRDFPTDGHTYQLGEIENGAGDPAAALEGPDGRLLVTLAGVHELAIGKPEQATWTRLPVGRRPTALAVDAKQRRAYVANTFSDSIAVVDLKIPRVIAEIPLGSKGKIDLDLSSEQRGEMLFFNARLSFEGWYSCHSCHTDGHTNGRLNDNFSDGSFGTPKRVLSLLGVKDTGPWAWNGQVKELEHQVRSSLKSTMQGPEPRAEDVRDLAAFLRTLPPPPALPQARGTIDEEPWKHGRKIFTQHKCGVCHAPPTYTSPKTYDVGLQDEVGGKHFNPPSLRGLSQGGPYFHDNRAQSLEEVFTKFRHGLEEPLKKQELNDLLYFLGGL